MAEIFRLSQTVRDYLQQEKQWLESAKRFAAHGKPRKAMAAALEAQRWHDKAFACGHRIEAEIVHAKAREVLRQAAESIAEGFRKSIEQSQDFSKGVLAQHRLNRVSHNLVTDEQPEPPQAA